MSNQKKDPSFGMTTTQDIRDFSHNAASMSCVTQKMQLDVGVSQPANIIKIYYHLINWYSNSGSKKCYMVDVRIAVRAKASVSASNFVKVRLWLLTLWRLWLRLLTLWRLPLRILTMWRLGFRFMTVRLRPMSVCHDTCCSMTPFILASS